MSTARTSHNQDGAQRRSDGTRAPSLGSAHSGRPRAAPPYGSWGESAHDMVERLGNRLTCVMEAAHATAPAGVHDQGHHTGGQHKPRRRQARQLRRLATSRAQLAALKGDAAAPTGPLSGGAARTPRTSCGNDGTGSQQRGHGSPATRACPAGLSSAHRTSGSSKGGGRGRAERQAQGSQPAAQQSTPPGQPTGASDRGPGACECPARPHRPATGERSRQTPKGSLPS